MSPITLVWGPYSPPSPTSVVISGVTATVLGTTSARIDVDLAPPGKAYVEYDSSASGALGVSTPVTASFLSHHAITILGLSPGVAYRYRVVGISTDGALTYGTEGTFATTPETVAGTVYGYGYGVTGGAGGIVCEVDNNNSSGSGSFRDAVLTSGPRTITFSVDGDITLASTLNPAANCTIAGETSGGDGITLKGWALQANGSGSNNHLWRQLRHRGWEDGGAPAANTGGECFGGISGAHHIVFQNLSGAWHADETFGFYRPCSDITVQDCILGEGVYASHNYPFIISEFTTRVSVFRNLMYRGEYRNPNVMWDDEGPQIAPAVMADVANNLVWPGSVANSYGTHCGQGARANVRYNYYGNTVNPALIEDTGASIYQTGNYSRNGRSIAGGSQSVAYSIPSAAVLPMLTSAADAAEYVLDHAGCRIGGLDAYDQAAVNAILSAGL